MGALQEIPREVLAQILDTFIDFGMSPLFRQNGSEVWSLFWLLSSPLSALKITPKLLQNGTKMALKSSPEDPWGSQKSVQAAFRLLEASWEPPGALLDRKSTLDRLLGALKEIPREVLAQILDTFIDFGMSPFFRQNGSGTEKKWSKMSLVGKKKKKRQFKH